MNWSNRGELNPKSGRMGTSTFEAEKFQGQAPEDVEKAPHSVFMYQQDIGNYDCGQVRSSVQGTVL